LCFSSEAKSQLLKFVKISDKAHIPTKGSPLAAGYDLYSAADIVSVFTHVGVKCSKRGNHKYCETKFFNK
jgi:dUTPase